MSSLTRWSNLYQNSNMREQSAPLLLSQPQQSKIFDPLRMSSSSIKRWPDSCMTRCNMLQHAATRCNTLQHVATRCNALRIECRAEFWEILPGEICIIPKSTSINLCIYQHIATHCNTLQHTATHCKTLSTWGNMISSTVAGVSSGPAFLGGWRPVFFGKNL